MIHFPKGRVPDKPEGTETDIKEGRSRGYAAKLSWFIFQCFAKIAKGESNDKTKTKFSGLALPSRLLSYEKIVKGESNDKAETQFSGLTLPSRLLSYGKIAKVESNGKAETQFSVLAYSGYLLSLSHL